MNRFPSTAGFTLIEIMVAIAILGISALVLLDTHYNSMRLHADTRDEVLKQQFMEDAMGQAESQVMAGSTSGTGTFGSKYPDYSYSFTAQPAGAQQGLPLYEVTVSLTTPTSGSTEKTAPPTDESSSDTPKPSSSGNQMTLFVYNLGQ